MVQDRGRASDVIFTRFYNPVGKLHQLIHDLGEQFRREALPDNLLQAAIPKDAVRDDDSRMFIRQLNLIRTANNRIRTAQEDHYRAFTSDLGG